MRSPVKIGTRQSPLALYQAELVCSNLEPFFPGIQFEIIKLQTKGDLVFQGDMKSIGERVFTHEIEQALLRQEIDIAVHSAKDLATELPEGLQIGAILEREDPRDCFVSRNKEMLAQLRPDAKIGTSSLRRKAQLRKFRPDAEVVEMRGNIETRLKKVEEGICDGTVLAYAGLKRLGLEKNASEIFDSHIFLPQAAQGAIAVEIRTEDSDMQTLTQQVNHGLSFFSVLAERSFLRRLEGGCQVPVGVASEFDGATLMLVGAIFSLDSRREVRDVISGNFREAEKLGETLASRLLTAGGRQILEKIRNV
jgi:hydroxymethylbilane synthase